MKYRIIGTGFQKYIDNYCDIFMNSKKGDKFNTLIENTKQTFILYKNKDINMKSLTTLQQNLSLWISVGLVEKMEYCYCIKFAPILNNQMFHFIRKKIIEYHYDEKIQNIRWTIIINTLYSYGEITLNDLEKLNSLSNIDRITEELIESAISPMEVTLSKDKEYIKKTKELLYEYKF
ncbi:hypothetical protein [Candidatus Mycoplasma mahonii]|uniref:hypothetical protein n=1 Tax=Candidatus Mycoplasma mahonii TaxID=3004105 RepID=UPI0026EEE3B4|nr:hypothetical protein [Candidatus Mycoplasma mahonii]WKX02773.1 hypothetical protein O3I44_01725 [Candidatus Mycoplasma mahonii]